MENYNLIVDLIKKYDNITIFRHQRPDGDAAGSQLGLKTWILDNFDNKNVYAIGNETFDIYPFVDKVDNETIENSLAIILDTANKERIDDDRWILAKESIKIDHHPVVQEYAKYNFADPEAAATCEYLCTILTSFNNYSISKNAAKFLYSGLLTDTISFKTSNTSANTFKAASVLADTGIDVYEINTSIFDKDLKTYNYCNYLRNKIIYDEGIAYAILTNEMLNECNVTASYARNYVSELGGVKDFKIWVLFTENEKGTFDASVRSKKAYIINEIAAKYHGGGHKNASGIKDLKTYEISLLLEDLKNIINITK